MPGPLKGMTVIEVSALSPPLCRPHIGADGGGGSIDPIGGGLDYNRWPVTKDGTSLYWAGLNKGKKSIALNVRDPKGRNWTRIDDGVRCRARYRHQPAGAQLARMTAEGAARRTDYGQHRRAP